MRKYFHAFLLNLQQYTHHRLDFLLGRLRSIIVLILLYSVWMSVSQTTGTFSSFTTNELVSYVILATVLRAFIFGSQSRRIAIEINDGTFSAYLLRPVNHFFFFYFRELAERCLLLLSAVIEVLLCMFFLNIHLEMPEKNSQWFWFFMSLFLAHTLYYILSYTVSLIAFWSRDAFGPRFLFEWFLEFASGAYFPLNILRPFLALILHMLPFVGLLFIPLMIYLGKIHETSVPSYILLQIGWVIISGILAHTVWNRGIRRYSGEGI